MCCRCRWSRAGGSARPTSARKIHAAVIGKQLAQQYGYLPGEVRTIRLNGLDYGIVGVLGDVELDPGLSNAVFITLDSAKADFGAKGDPTKVYIRSQDGKTPQTATMIPTAIALGGTDEVAVDVPSDALKASAQADKTLQQTALFAGLLALAVGGLGIANVMSISVIQRSSEIGIRRALGHTRSTIAAQFLLEAIFVGLFGGLIGAALGVAIVRLDLVRSRAGSSSSTTAACRSGSASRSACRSSRASIRR